MKKFFTLIAMFAMAMTAGAQENVLCEDYQADGNGFSHNVTIDWAEQKLVASVDVSACSDDKDIFAVTTPGGDFSGFNGTESAPNMHVYFDKGTVQCYYAFPGTNNNSGKKTLDGNTVLFEINVDNGLMVNGTTAIEASALTTLFGSSEITVGSGESPKFSNALYNYIKVVPLDETPDAIASVEANQTATPVAYFNTLGASQNGLQKGVNIVRLANGKTVKVLR